MSATAFCGFLFPLSACSADPGAVRTTVDQGTGTAYVDGEILLFTDSSVSDADDGLSVAQEGADFLQGTVLEKLDSMPIYRVRVSVSGKAELDRLCERLMEQDISGLSGAMVDLILESDSGNDPAEVGLLSELTQRTSKAIDWESVIHLDGLSDQVGDLPGVKIGIVDSGFDFEASGLDVEASDAVVAYCESQPDVANVHGTIVAELAGAGNTDGTPGVASDRTPIYCSAYGAFVDSHEDLPDGEIRFSALMDAIGDCVLNGCKVVNLSQGVSPKRVGMAVLLPDREQLQLSREYAITYMAYLRDVLNKDFLLVQAAGNMGHRDLESQTGFFTNLDYEDLLHGMERRLHVNVDPKAEDGFGWSSEMYLRSLFTKLRNQVIVVGGVRDLGGGDLAYDDGVAHGSGIDILAPTKNIPIPLCTRDGVVLRDDVYLHEGTSFAAPMVTGVVSMVWGKYGGHSADIKTAVVGGSTERVGYLNTSQQTAFRDWYFVLDGEQACRYRKQIVDFDFGQMPLQYDGDMPDSGQKNIRLSISNLYGDSHLSNIMGFWAFSLEHSRRKTGDSDGAVDLEFNGSVYGQFYPPMRDRDGNWWLRLMPLNAQPDSSGFGYYDGKLCLDQHRYWVNNITTDNGVTVQEHYEEPYGAQDLGLLRIYPKGTKATDLPSCVPDSRIIDGKLNCYMLYQVTGVLPGGVEHVYYGI